MKTMQFRLQIPLHVLARISTGFTPLTEHAQVLDSGSHSNSNALDPLTLGGVRGPNGKQLNAFVFRFHEPNNP
jgi:hypothetical protein